MATTTLLIFTRGAARETARRRLLPAGLGGLEHELHDRCLRSVIDAGLGAGMSVTVAAAEPLELAAGIRRLSQHGCGFGERLAGALTAARQPGRALVLVGADVPGLGVDHLRAATELMRGRPERVVVGPSPDGGFYLLASHAPLDQHLNDVRWCTPNALSSLTSTLRNAGFEVVFLETLGDLDRPQDLHRWLAQPCARWRVLRGRLQTALAQYRRAAPQRVARSPRVRALRRVRERAPPHAA